MAYQMEIESKLSELQARGIVSVPYVKDQVMVVPVSHRELPSEDDFMTALNFQRESGLIGILNLRGSGGSLPDHLHFEFGRANLPVLQLSSNQDYIDYYGVPLTTLTDYPGSVLVLQDRNEAKLASNTYTLTHTLSDFGLSFNLIITHDRVLIMPRVAVESRAFPGWSVGGLFLSGIFVPDCRGSLSQDSQALFEFLKERFSFIDADRYKSVIESVTLPEAGVREFINRLHLSFGSNWISSVSDWGFMKQQHPV